jgi:hypothetical protein
LGFGPGFDSGALDWSALGSIMGIPPLFFQRRHLC